MPSVTKEASMKTFKIKMHQTLVEIVEFCINVESEEDIDSRISEMESEGTIPWQPYDVIDKQWDTTEIPYTED